MALEIIAVVRDVENVAIDTTVLIQKDFHELKLASPKISSALLSTLLYDSYEVNRNLALEILSSFTNGIPILKNFEDVNVLLHRGIQLVFILVIRYVN